MQEQIDSWKYGNAGKFIHHEYVFLLSKHFRKKSFPLTSKNPWVSHPFHFAQAGFYFGQQFSKVGRNTPTY